MHIECFDYFYKVAKAKSISKVAKNTHISQSALSQQIQKLEESLGYRLLERSNKGVELTQMGIIALKYSENIIRTYNKMIEEMNSNNKHQYTIKIEACPSVANYALPCSIFKVKNKYPYHKYELLSNNSDDRIKENIINNICDVGFAYNTMLDNEPSLEYSRVGTSRIVLVALNNMNIPKEITVKELLEHPIITLTENNEIHKRLKTNLKKYGYSFDDLNSVFEMDSIEAIKSSILRGYGIAFLPYVSVKEELYKKQYKSIKINDDFDMDYDVYIFSKKTEYKNRVVDEFIHYFKEIGEKSFC